MPQRASSIGRRRWYGVVAIAVATIGGAHVAAVSFPVADASERVPCVNAAAIGYDPLSTTFPNFRDEGAIAAGIDAVISAREPSSPMVGMGRYIVDASRPHDVNPLWIVASAWQETQFGTSGRAARNGNTGNFWGIDKGNKAFSSPEAGISSFAKNIRWHLDGGGHVRYQYAATMFDYFMVHQTGGIYRPGSYQELSPAPHTGQPMPIHDSVMNVDVSWNTSYTPLNYYKGMISVINSITGLELPNVPDFDGDGLCEGDAAPGTLPPAADRGPVVPGDAKDPVGFFLDVETRGSGEIGLWGWAVDPDTPTTSIPVHVYVTTADGETTYHELMADHSRPDVPKVHPQYGSKVGFEHIFGGLPAGPVTVQVFAIDSSDPRCQRADVCNYTDLGSVSGEVVVTPATTQPPATTAPPTTSPPTTAPPPATTTPPATTQPPPTAAPPAAPPATTAPPPTQPPATAPPVPATPPPTQPPAPAVPTGAVRTVRWYGDNETAAAGVVSLANWDSPIQMRSVVNGNVQSVVYSDAGGGERAFSVPFTPSGDAVCVDANNGGNWTRIGCRPVISGQVDGVSGGNAVGTVSVAGWTNGVYMRATVDGGGASDVYSDGGDGARRFTIPISAGAGSHEVCVSANLHGNWHRLGCRTYAAP